MAQKEMVLLCLFPRQDSASLPVNGTLNKRSYKHTHTHTHTCERHYIIVFFLYTVIVGGGVPVSYTLLPMKLIRRGFAHSNLRILINAETRGLVAWKMRFSFLLSSWNSISSYQKCREKTIQLQTSKWKLYYCSIQIGIFSPAVDLSVVQQINALKNHSYNICKSFEIKVTIRVSPRRVCIYHKLF